LTSMNASGALTTVLQMLLASTLKVCMGATAVSATPCSK